MVLYIEFSQIKTYLFKLTQTNMDKTIRNHILNYITLPVNYKLVIFSINI
jgi:hypothetical protein